jgi:hypothetical protein
VFAPGGTIECACQLACLRAFRPHYRTRPQQPHSLTCARRLTSARRSRHASAVSTAVPFSKVSSGGRKGEAWKAMAHATNADSSSSSSIIAGWRPAGRARGAARPPILPPAGCVLL